jgi:hypothetical protein
VDPPSGEPSFVAETSDMRGRSVVRGGEPSFVAETSDMRGRSVVGVHGSASV